MGKSGLMLHNSTGASAHVNGSNEKCACDGPARMVALSVVSAACVAWGLDSKIREEYARDRPTWR